MDSYTSARIYVGVPNATSLSQADLDAVYAGILAANVTWVRISLPWNVIQPIVPITTTVTTKVVTTTNTTLFSGTVTTVTTVTTDTGTGTPTVTTDTKVGPTNLRTFFPRTFVSSTTNTAYNSAPTFSWEAADLAVNRALAAGLNVQVVLAPPYPNWVLKINPTTFTDFARAVANRYKPGGAGITVPGRFVQEYQVWHEPNAVANWPSSVNGMEYAAVLKAAYQAIKASHSGATVVMAALQDCMNASRPAIGTTKASVSHQEPVAYLTAMYNGGVKGYFDVAAYNPLSVSTLQFPEPLAPSGMTMRRADAFWTALKAREPNKKVHWSAVGYDTSVFSPVQQAAYLDTLRWFAEERKAWVSGLGLHSYRD